MVAINKSIIVVLYVQFNTTKFQNIMTSLVDKTVRLDKLPPGIIF